MPYRGHGIDAGSKNRHRRVGADQQGQIVSKVKLRVLIPKRLQRRERGREIAPEMGVGRHVLRQPQHRQFELVFHSELLADGIVRSEILSGGRFGYNDGVGICQNRVRITL